MGCVWRTPSSKRSETCRRASGEAQDGAEVGKHEPRPAVDQHGADGLALVVKGREVGSHGGGRPSAPPLKTAAIPRHRGDRATLCALAVEAITTKSKPVGKRWVGTSERGYDNGPSPASLLIRGHFVVAGTGFEPVTSGL